MPLEKKYFPVFAGKTSEGEKIVLYHNVDDEEEVHIQLNDGEIQTLSHKGKMTVEFDLSSDTVHINIESLEWTGTATGTKRDLMEAQSR